jgi:hypothetical protein
VTQDRAPSAARPRRPVQRTAPQIRRTWDVGISSDARVSNRRVRRGCCPGTAPLPHVPEPEPLSLPVSRYFIDGRARRARRSGVQTSAVAPCARLSRAIVKQRDGRGHQPRKRARRRVSVLDAERFEVLAVFERRQHQGEQPDADQRDGELARPNQMLALVAGRPLELKELVNRESECDQRRRGLIQAIMVRS